MNKLKTVIWGISALILMAQSDIYAWSMKPVPSPTKWAKDVDPNDPLPEYPRPQLVRTDWLNLNGIWEFQAGLPSDLVPSGRKLDAEILVPFPVESALSGVMQRRERVWYRRTFIVPEKWSDKNIKLNFGAVDFESEVFINGKSAGIHRGGYDAFGYDITHLLSRGGPQEVIVRVYDPTESGGQPRGKQTSNPGGIMYTPVTGIWQTVWLEPVAAYSIKNLKITPDVDAGVVRLSVNSVGDSQTGKVRIKVLDEGKVVQALDAAPNVELAIPIPLAKLWSPDSPFLYDLEVELLDGATLADRVTSYFGMRKIALGKVDGVTKMILNGKFEFQVGPLDQGFWPEGIYTAPTEEAIKSDIQAIKNFGFNMVRKHIKVEPARWYYWTDRLGLLVWQDMPSANSYPVAEDAKPLLDKGQFKHELQMMLENLHNYPSIILWVIFNEGQGQHDTAELVKFVKALDPSRLVNEASGRAKDSDPLTDSGDILDVHSYPHPGVPPPRDTQALVCGEYGGIGYIMQGNGWGYTTVSNQADFIALYSEFMKMNKVFSDRNGLSGVVYTQLTDVETENNGLLTYNRVVKIDPDLIAHINRFAFPDITYQPLLPTSEVQRQEWRYTTISPKGDWRKSEFDDSRWPVDNAPFGNGVNDVKKTPWVTPEIWLRKVMRIGDLTPEQLQRVVIRHFHDEDVEVFINGVSAFSGRRFNKRYDTSALKPEGRAALRPNADNLIAVHCRQTTGGQYIDVGLYERSINIVSK